MPLRATVSTTLRGGCNVSGHAENVSDAAAFRCADPWFSAENFPSQTLARLR
jgi:hypothetical protein